VAFVFDSGYLFGVMPNKTPVKFGSLQGIEAELDFKLFDSPLQLQAAIGTMATKLKMDFKAKAAQMDGLLLNQLFFGQTPASGSEGLVRDQAGTIPASGPYTITPALPAGGTWRQDLSVQYATSGAPLTLVPSGPTQGQYSVSAGVYTFAAADASLGVAFNFLYTMTTGLKLALVNKFSYLAPYFQVVLNTTYNGKQVTWNLARCASKNLKLATSLEKFAIPEFSFSAMADQTGQYGNIGTFSFS
jgi:hypothetical protein